MSDSFVEKGDVYNERIYGTELKRQLKRRHVAMISIGGVIGTGLFFGTASALRNGGPVGLLIGYVVMGTICYSAMISLGEMISYLPIPGGHIKLAERFVNKSLSFAMGWNYWYNWTVVLTAELNAAAVMLNFWNKSVNNAAWISMCLGVVVVINFLGAGVYGEVEFIFASIKVITLVGLIILGIVLDLGGGPNHDRVGFRYWKNPGPFVQYQGIGGHKGQFLGWWAAMIQSAAFAYMGTEIVAIAAGEAKNPRMSMPKAIRRVYIRILVFYIGGALVIGLLVPSNHPGLNLKDRTAAASPFVIAIKKAGISGLSSVINAALFSSAWSAASSDLFTSSRAMYGLAISGNAPKIFARTSRNGLPWVAVSFCSMFGLLAYMGVNEGSGRVFQWFSNMTIISGLNTWSGIAITYIRFYAGLKAKGIKRSELPFSSPLQPFAAWYTLIGTFVICLFGGFNAFLKGDMAVDIFVTNYFPFILFPILYFATRMYYGEPMVAAKDMDFTTGLREIENASYHEEEPGTILEKFWGWIM